MFTSLLYPKNMADKKKKAEQLDGLLLLDKPQGLTSTRCLEKIKKKTRQKKIGHAGTLDPIARGILVVLLGQATKLSSYLSSGNKTYWVRVRLGLQTDTYDQEGTIIAERPCNHIEPKTVQKEILGFRELKEQIIPPYSAAKHQGVPFYTLKRSGQEVPEKTKAIHIDQVQILSINFPFVSFRITCSAGTFVRSLAHSLGTRLGCGAIMTELVREKSQPFELEQAYSLQEILEEPERLEDKIIDLSEGLPDWSKYSLPLKKVQEVKNGKWLRTDEVPGTGPVQEKTRALFQTVNGQPIALVEARHQDSKLYWAILRGLWTN